MGPAVMSGPELLAFTSIPATEGPVLLRYSLHMCKKPKV